MTRTSNGRGTFDPRRSTVRSCRARNSLACKGSAKSPISSIKMVPPLASSKRPRRVCPAPVKAPFSWPKSSSSIKESGKLQTEKATKGLAALGLKRWMAWAINPFPVPLSPVSSTVVNTSATFRVTSQTRCIALLLPSKPSTLLEPRSLRASASSRAKSLRRQARSRANRSCCTSNGWRRVSNAPFMNASRTFCPPASQL